jgi:hypothetical protein
LALKFFCVETGSGLVVTILSGDSKYLHTPGEVGQVADLPNRETNRPHRSHDGWRTREERSMPDEPRRAVCAPGAVALSFYRRPVHERRTTMSFFSWLRNGIHSAAIKCPGRHRPARKLATFRPRLEALEGRDVPSTLTVTNNLDSGTGSLRAEIAAAKSKDTIVFDPSLKGQTITLTSGQLEISKSLTIQGLGAGQLTVSGDSLSRVFQVDQKVTVTLSGMTISNGYAGYLFNLYSYDGGGILNLGTLTVGSCTLSGNHADGTTESLTFISTHGGGGIYNAGTLTVSNSTLTSNQAVDEGGGIFNAFRGTATISGCTLSSPGPFFQINPNAWQSANDGGAIFNAGTMTVNSCTYSYNFANYFGGAIDNAGGLTVSNSVFSGNIAAPPGRLWRPPTTTTSMACTSMAAATPSPENPDAERGEIDTPAEARKRRSRLPPCGSTHLAFD